MGTRLTEYGRQPDAPAAYHGPRQEAGRDRCPGDLGTKSDATPAGEALGGISSPVSTLTERVVSNTCTATPLAAPALAKSSTAATLCQL